MKNIIKFVKKYDDIILLMFVILVVISDIANYDTLSLAHFLSYTFVIFALGVYTALQTINVMAIAYSKGLEDGKEDE